MNDRAFLIWIHQRLVEQHNESPLFDYMHRLRAIIANTDPNVESPSSASNSIESLLAHDEKNRPI